MDSTVIDVTSDEFLGQWKRLVSTTNWDKGRIIAEWREALIAAAAPVAEYSDEAWSRRVGNVTAQHVGRLRRVFERFGEVRDEYPGLYWSHFQAALDWSDAEMWLEGAVQSNWSIADMRSQRWEALGAPADLKPRDEDIISAQLDDDADPEDGTSVRAELEVVRAPEGEDDQPPFDVAGDDAERDGAAGEPLNSVANSARELAEPVRPFANLPSLPADVNDAFDAYKLCILRHKLAGWTEISCDDLLASLDSLKELALAPAEA